MNKNKDQRLNTRTSCPDNSIRIFYSDAAGSHELDADIIDISATAIGLSTDTQLTKGQAIEFGKGHPNWSLPDQGIIVWSIPDKARYRLGLQFTL